MDGDLRRRGPSVPMSAEAAADAFGAMWADHLLIDALDRIACPWEYADPNPMPRFTPLPRLARFGRRQAIGRWTAGLFRALT